MKRSTIILIALAFLLMGAKWFPIRNMAILDSGGNGVLIKEGSVLMPVSASMIQPSTVVEFTVACDANGEQFPSNAVAGEIVIQLQQAALSTVYIGGSGVSTSSVWIDLAASPSAKFRYSNTDKLFCLCSSCTETVTVHAEGV